MLHIPPERVVLLGQSLGTAVASAVALRFADDKNGLLPPDSGHGAGASATGRVEFAGVILVATFTSLSKLLETYRIAGLIPILSPLRPYPYLQRLLVSCVADTWETAARIAELVRVSKQNGRRLRLHLIHAVDDWDIRWRHSEELFYVAANASSEDGVSRVELEGWRDREGTRGRVETWGFGEGGEVLLQILKFGGEYQYFYHRPSLDYR